MSSTFIYLIIFGILMFFMHRSHGSMGGCGGGHSHSGHGQRKPDGTEKSQPSMGHAGYVHHH